MNSKQQVVKELFRIAKTITIHDIKDGILLNPNDGLAYQISMHNSVAYQLRTEKEADTIITFVTTDSNKRQAHIQLFRTVKGVH
jgi:hypothetical protein